MEFKLSSPVQVYDDKSGSYVKKEIVIVEFKGKKGNKALKSLQDQIMLAFHKFNKSTVKKNDLAQSEESKKDIVGSDILQIIELSGYSEDIFDAVMDKLKYFATIDGHLLSDNMQDQMAIDDLDSLYLEVIKSFLLQKLLSLLNGMKK